jgi:hypothetical protein
MEEWKKRYNDIPVRKEYTNVIFVKDGTLILTQLVPFSVNIMNKSLLSI